jgi:hypothetical protein
VNSRRKFGQVFNEKISEKAGKTWGKGLDNAGKSRYNDILHYLGGVCPWPRELDGNQSKKADGCGKFLRNIDFLSKVCPVCPGKR